MPTKSINPYARILPFPVGPILLAESMITADGRIYRAALAICFAYWLSGCRELPRDHVTLGMLARLPQSHMTALKPQLDKVLAELLPLLAAEYATRRETRTMQRAIALHASREADRRRALKGNQDGKSFSDAPNSPRLQPATIPPRHDDGRTDMRAWRDADKRHKATASATTRGTHGFLSDGTRRVGSK